MPPRRASRFAVRDEFLNLDFSSPAQLYEFSRHPFIRRLTNEHLEPMVQYFLRIREDFSWTERIKTADEKTALRQHLRSYLDHAGHLADIIIRFEDLARADRIPCPKVSWLYLVIRDEQFYGFEGDEEGLLKIVLKGKLATLFAYSTALRQRSVDRLFVGDGPSRNAEAMFTLPETEFEDGEVALIDALQSQGGFRREAEQYSNSADGVLSYVFDIRGYAEAILRALPRTAQTMDQMPLGRVDSLRGWVIEYIIQASLIFDIMMAWARLSATTPWVDSRALKVLRLAEDFDFRFGRPSTGFSPHLRGHYTSRIRSCIEIAVKGQRPNDMDDVPLQPQVACLPYVPSWNLEQIRSLQLQERSDPYAGKNARMFEEIEFADNLSYQISQEAGYRENGYSPPSSGRYSTSMVVLAKLAADKLQYSETELEVLWIHRVRHLAQGVLHLACLPNHEAFPARLSTSARAAIRLLMENMVVLARASVKYGPYKAVSIPKFFVPCESTTVFRLVEGFVDIFGFTGDEDVGRRNGVFENMETLYGCMILNPRYCFHPVDFPGFSLTDDEMDTFGITRSMKQTQLSRPLFSGNVFRHLFGQNLLRYNPGLGESERHKIGLDISSYTHTYA
ncbi:hypothetical protein B0H11DRAFT_1929884 [Mycena galericulata]|nr:hypothetical protein B0H11DRAFT_1929884 [Mycena galericulata]